jgi:hypothetical protein
MRNSKPPAPDDPTPLGREPSVNEFARRRHPAQPPSLRARLRRRTAIVSRWLHIYLSMAAFAIILFFAVTGFTLNHVDRFAGKDRVVQVSGQMPRALLRPASGDPPRLEIAERLREAHHIHGTLTDFRVDDRQILVSFRGPGYAADAFIDRDSDHYDLTETSSGAVAVINDLHRGASTGPAWSLVIDACAILLTLVALSGLLLLFFLYKRRSAGLIVAAVGALLCWIVYSRLVP